VITIKEIKKSSTYSST